MDQLHQFCLAKGMEVKWPKERFLGILNTIMGVQRHGNGDIMASKFTELLILSIWKSFCTNSGSFCSHRVAGKSCKTCHLGHEAQVCKVKDIAKILP
jgi:hypothetical protein